MNTEFEYINVISRLLQKAYEVNRDVIPLLSEKFADNIMADGIIHIFGTGHSHMTALEMFTRAGGLGNIEAMLDPDVLLNYGTERGGEVERLPGLADIIAGNYSFKPGDILVVVSNSGRNAVPIEMAMRGKKDGLLVVAVTSKKESEKMTSRHPSGKKLYEIADIVLDNCAPDGDCCIRSQDLLIGPVSSMTSIMLVNTVATEAIKICQSRGFKPLVYQSQNVDNYDNTETYLHYKPRMRHL